MRVDLRTSLSRCEYSNAVPERIRINRTIAVLPLFQIDFHADGAAAGADQPVVDRLTGQHDAFGETVAHAAYDVGSAVDLVETKVRGSRSCARAHHVGTPSRATSPSIHAATSCISARGSLPVGDIGLPIVIVIIPGFLPKMPLGHR